MKLTKLTKRTRCSTCFNPN